ncbi:MAG: Holliday junction branch migration DNA helicase RuvB [Lachnospiraceae bacterium]|nr:Holliday junction branch migration DNA helicase RuvB [Lachnospiraceae bacterium]
MQKRIITTEKLKEDKEIETTLRPLSFDEYIGQESLKGNLKIYIEAAKRRNDVLDHCLFFGPPGLGKTTVAGIIANEMGADIKFTSGPAIEKQADMAAILCNLKPGTILFVDEIHRLSRQIEEFLYSAMEDFCIDTMIGKEGTTSAKSIRIPLPHFTLIGATTRAGMISEPLRDRFGIIENLKYYDSSELQKIVMRSSKVLNVEIDEEGAYEIARRSRGTPRLANRLLKRVRDVAMVLYDGNITFEAANKAIDMLGIDPLGLDNVDNKLLDAMINRFGGRPVGIDALATTIGEDPGTIEDMYEPYLVQTGLILRTPRGRIPSETAYHHLGISQN